MSSERLASSVSYVLATGAAATRRLHVLHDIYSPTGRRVLRQAGLTEGMKVADFGCLKLGEKGRSENRRRSGHYQLR